MKFKIYKIYKNTILLFYLCCICFLHYFIAVFKYKGDKANSNGKRVLILSYFNLGDIVCDSASLRAIRNSWPDAYIHVLVRRDEGIQLLKNCKYVDKVEKITSQIDSVIDYIRQVKHLRNYNFTHSFQLVRHFDQIRKSHLPYVLNIPNRFGILNEKNFWLFRRCYTKFVGVGKRWSRKIESIEVVKLAGIEVLNEYTECWINETVSEVLTKKLDLHSSIKDFIIIHPGSDLDIKCWPAEYYAKLIDRLASTHKNRIFVTGTRREIDILNQIKETCKSKIEIICDLSLEEFLALINYSKLIITNDTGPLHFAIALKKAVIGIFGPTPPDYAVGRDIPTNCVILRANTNCKDSQLCNIYLSMSLIERSKNDSICRNAQRVCMRSIPVEVVEFMSNQLLLNKFNNETTTIKPSNNIQNINKYSSLLKRGIT